jgi:geranylgeranyl reductase family protein
MVAYDTSRRDVIIVGGGPAGSALACFLRHQGHDVLLFDAARFPRDKICGEAVSPPAWGLFEAIGAAEAVRALRPHPLRGMRLTSPDGTAFRGDYPGENPPGLAVRRRDLDATLLARARALGAEVQEGTRITGLLRRGGTVEGVEAEGADGPSRHWTSRLVVGADGRNSIVATHLELRRPHPRLRRFAVRGYWEGMEGLDDHGEMHVAGRGYCGIAPLSPTLANVAFVLPQPDMAAAAGDVEGFYREGLRSRWPRLAERLDRGHLAERPRVIGPLAVEARALVAPGALLVGDAAGFYDPFTGEGITLALRTAELAARTISDVLDARGAAAAASEALEAYERSFRTATRQKFRFNRLLQVAVGWPDAANLMARRLARRPDLADRLVGIAGDFVPARTALGPRFLWDLLTA